MAPRSCAQWSPCINPPTNSTGEQDELASQDPIQEFNTGNNKAPTKAPTPPLIPPSTKNLFTKFMKMFMEITQAQAQALIEPQKQLFKARTPKTYWDKSHIECYHFC